MGGGGQDWIVSHYHRIEKEQKRAKPSRAEIIAFDYSLWMSPLAFGLHVSWLAKNFHGRNGAVATERRQQQRLLAAGCWLYPGTRTRTRTSLRRLSGSAECMAGVCNYWNCSMARNPIDFYANEITRLLPFRSLRSSKSKTLIFIYRSELSAAATNKGGKGRQKKK